MPFDFRRLDISTKLLLSALAFVLPVAVLMFFMDISFRYDIRLGSTELAGTAYLRRVEPVLRLIPEHRALSAAVLMGEADAEPALDALTNELDAVFRELPRHHGVFLDAVRGAPSSVTDVLVRKTSPEEIARLWADTKSDMFKTGHGALLRATVDLIHGVADCALLSVDPALDSAYLADAVVLHAPRAMAALFEIGLLAEHLPPGLDAPDPMQREDIAAAMAQYLALGVAPIRESGRAALDLDDAFYDRSPALHTEFAPLLADYTARADALVAALQALRQGRAAPEAAGMAARQALSKLCSLHATGLDRLDRLIALRIDSYARWRTMAFSFGALSVLLAVALIWRTWRSVSAGIRGVRDYAALVAAGDFDAEPFGGADVTGAELRDMTADIGTMVARLKNKIGHLDGILQGLTVPCLVVDTEERLTFINRHYLELYERNGEPREYLGQRLADFFYGDPEHETLTGRAMRGNERFRDLEVESATAKGNPIHVRYDVAPIHDPDGLLLGAFAVIVDLTRLKRQQARILHAATHDDLTGLPNKSVFLRRIGEAAACTMDDPDRAFAVLLLDVDNFKHVNDSLGHDFGDALILEIARRMGRVLREGDLLVRLGGDEFGVVLDPVDGADQATSVADAIHAELARPFEEDGREVFLTAGIGAVLGRQCDRSAQDMLRDADTAMYRAKGGGAGRTMLFDETMHEAVRKRLELQTDMKNAVEREEFEPYYQPIVDLATGRVHGFEALVRWNHPRRGLVSPGVFIPLAEETGLVVPMGAQVLDRALSQAARWRKDIPAARDLTMSVNLAVEQLMRPDIVDEVRAAIERSGLPPGAVKLEITESGIMDNAEAALAAQDRLKELGVALSIDDFGTGYSSLSYLNRFPFDYLKVDQSFVFAMHRGAEQMEIVRTIVGLAHSLGRRVIAEGIEDAAALSALRELGCEYGQGYHFARPMPAAEARALLEENPSW